MYPYAQKRGFFDDALLRVISREKDILRFLFVSRKASSLRTEQALEHFLSQDSRRLDYLLEHGVIREADGLLVLEDTYLRFFEEVLEVNEEINVLSVKRKRLENLDRKREDIALLIKEAEKLFDERQRVFFGPSMDAHLKETVASVKDSLTESYHGLLELDRQIIVYLNKIEAEQRLVEKIRRIKYLKDQLVWESGTGR